MVKKKYIPKRGDVVWINFDPAAGHEQMGKRPALVLSPTPFNKKIKLTMVAQITSRVRGHGFEVPLIKLHHTFCCQPRKRYFVPTDCFKWDIFNKERAMVRNVT